MNNTEGSSSQSSEGRRSTLTASEERKLKFVKVVAFCSPILGLVLCIVSLVVGFLLYRHLSSTTRSHFQLASVTMFTIGSCALLVAVYTCKRAAKLGSKRQTTEILISSITDCGLLKSPTPASIRRPDILAAPFSVDDDPPKYEVAVNTHPSTSATDTITTDHDNQGYNNEFDNALAMYTITADNRGDSEAANALNIDEDVDNPPPSYEEALELVFSQQRQEERAEGSESN